MQSEFEMQPDAQSLEEIFSSCAWSMLHVWLHGPQKIHVNLDGLSRDDRHRRYMVDSAAIRWENRRSLLKALSEKARLVGQVMSTHIQIKQHESRDNFTYRVRFYANNSAGLLKFVQLQINFLGGEGHAYLPFANIRSNHQTLTAVFGLDLVRRFQMNLTVAIEREEEHSVGSSVASKSFLGSIDSAEILDFLMQEENEAERLIVPVENCYAAKQESAMHLASARGSPSAEETSCVFESWKNDTRFDPQYFSLSDPLLEFQDQSFKNTKLTRDDKARSWATNDTLQPASKPLLGTLQDVSHDDKCAAFGHVSPCTRSKDASSSILASDFCDFYQSTPHDSFDEEESCRDSSRDLDMAFLQFMSNSDF